MLPRQRRTGFGCERLLEQAFTTKACASLPRQHATVVSRTRQLPGVAVPDLGGGHASQVGEGRQGMARTRYLGGLMGLVCGVVLTACGGGDGQEPQAPPDESLPEGEQPNAMPSAEGTSPTPMLEVSTEGSISSVTSGVAQL